MLESLLTWFNAHPKECHTLVRILTRKEHFSLRLVDWMVTNYTKTHKISVMFRGLPLDVHDDYQRHLCVYNKRLFDPFARRQRLRFAHPSGVVTTVGQMNFLRWFLERGLDAVLVRFRAEIESHMKSDDEPSSPIVLVPPVMSREAYRLTF